MIAIKQNERSWGIEIISEINSMRNICPAITLAGGECGIKCNGQTLFPDILLYGKSGVVQGWELKLPDTSISNTEFYENAERKARALQLNSFVLWNGACAIIYVQDNGIFTNKKKISADINSRESLFKNKHIWKETLKAILLSINELISTGTIHTTHGEALLNAEFITKIIHTAREDYALAIRQQCGRDTMLEARLAHWWESNYPDLKSNNSEKYLTLGEIGTLRWVTRMLFAHYLKGFQGQAVTVDQIGDKILDPNKAELLFSNLSKECDFYQVFGLNDLTGLVDRKTWATLISVNLFLKDLICTKKSYEMLSNVLDTLQSDRRKCYGAYGTPDVLAELLVRVVLTDKAGTVWDPCCGTGSIPSKVYNIKREFAIAPKNASEAIWASDKHQIPLQLCAVSMSRAETMRLPLQLFQQDVLSIKPEQAVKLIDPNNGQQIYKQLPLFDFVISNLPFVRQELLEGDTDFIGNWNGINKRTDLYGYIILHLSEFVKKSGKVGVIIANSWLSSQWGKEFRRELAKVFKIEKIITSENGRWFENATVVTTIITLQKKIDEIEGETWFHKIRPPIQEWEGNVERIARAIHCNANNDNVSSNLIPIRLLRVLDTIGVSWDSCFDGLDWLGSIQDYLVPLENYSEITRGERTGCDAAFLLEKGDKERYNLHNFVVPIVKGFQKGLIATPTSEGFNCNLNIESLPEGVRKWIEDKMTNAQTKHAKHSPWYALNATKREGFLFLTSPGERLGVFLLKTPTIVWQSYSIATPKNGLDTDLVFALLNSAVSLALIEAAGTARGEGALALSGGSIKTLRMLNPDLMASKRECILESFLPIKERQLGNILDELKDPKRRLFDDAVCRAIGISREAVYSFLSTRVSRRLKNEAYTKPSCKTIGSFVSKTASTDKSRDIKPINM